MALVQRFVVTEEEHRRIRRDPRWLAGVAEQGPLILGRKCTTSVYPQGRTNDNNQIAFISFGFRS
jgi:hypothetical protein